MAAPGSRARCLEDADDLAEKIAQVIDKADFLRWHEGPGSTSVQENRAAILRAKPVFQCLATAAGNLAFTKRHMERVLGSVLLIKSGRGLNPASRADWIATMAKRMSAARRPRRRLRDGPFVGRLSGSFVLCFRVSVFAALRSTLP